MGGPRGFNGRHAPAAAVSGFKAEHVNAAIPQHDTEGRIVMGLRHKQENAIQILV